MPAVTIVNYGMGNLGSIQSALEFLGAKAIVSDSARDIEAAERLILPGVGSFGLAMNNLRARGFIDAIGAFAASGARPLLGICLGMQLLATQGEEGGETEGLGLIPGRVKRFSLGDRNLKIPHVGFNSTSFTDPVHPVFRGLGTGADFYFVHSFHFQPDSRAHAIGTAEYGDRFTAAVARENVIGTQFHPEKSQANGLRVLKNFLEI